MDPRFAEQNPRPFFEPGVARSGLHGRERSPPWRAPRDRSLRSASGGPLRRAAEALNVGGGNFVRSVRRVTLLLVAMGAACVHGAEQATSAATIVSHELQDPDMTRASPLATRVARGVVEGSLAEASQRHNRDRIDGILADATASALLGTVREPGAVGGSGDVGGGSPVAVVSQRAAISFAEAVAAELRRQLGDDGQGPLTQAVSAATGEIGASAVRRVRTELAAEASCKGPDASGCAERRLTELGRATAVGFVSGVRDALGPLPWIAMVGMLGAVAAAFVWAFAILRAVRQSA